MTRERIFSLANEKNHAWTNAVHGLSPGRRKRLTRRLTSPSVPEFATGPQPPHPGPLHPREDLLLRFLRGETTPAENCQVVRHLLTGCPQCVGVTARVWSRSEAMPNPVPLPVLRGSVLGARSRSLSPAGRPLFPGLHPARYQDGPLKRKRCIGSRESWFPGYGPN